MSSAPATTPGAAAAAAPATQPPPHVESQTAMGEVMQSSGPPVLAAAAAGGDAGEGKSAVGAGSADAAAAGSKVEGGVGAGDAASGAGDSGSAEVETEQKSPPSISSTPVSVPITILLQSGVRHQFAIDAKYLERHGVKAELQKEVLSNPFDMTVYQLKECVWKDWKEDWDPRPASALFIKLIQFGAYMVDNNLLRDCRVTAEGPNVIHMAIRPAEAGDDDITQRSTKGGYGSRDRERNSRTPSCRCVIL